MLWLKWLHIVFMVTWFAGLFYLPRLFVYHAMSEDAASRERFKVMERKLYYGIMVPGAVLTVLFGLWLWLGHGPWGYWVHAKFALVLVLIAYHLYCGRLLKDCSGRGEKEFRCPCHNSSFTIDGQRVQPGPPAPPCPSPRDLDPLEVDAQKLATGEVWVKFENFRKGIPERVPEA